MNPITAVVKGTQNTVDQARKNVAQAAKSAMPSPSEAVYNLGMGIGPLLRNIASEMKKEQDKDKKDKKDTSNPANPKSGLVGKKEFSALTTQIGSMITVLKDIREIGRMQLRADQQRLFEARRQQYLGKEAEQESGLLEKPSAAASGGKGGSGSGIFGALGAIGDMVPGLLKLAAAGFAGKWVWDNVFDEKTRTLIKDRLTELVGNLGEKIIDSMWTAYKDAFEAAPITTALTTVATAYLAARITGLAAGMGLAYKGGKWVGEQMVDKPAPSKVNPKGAAGAGTTGGAAAATAAEARLAEQLAAQTANATAARQSAVETRGMTQAERMKYNRAKRAEQLAIRQEIEALEKAKATGTGIKPGGGTGIGTKVARGLGVVGSGLSLYGAYENWGDDKKWSAGLYGLSGTLGLAAVGSAATGVGLPAAPWLAGGSAVTGFAGLGVDWLESWLQNRDNDKKEREIETRLGELKKAEINASMEANRGRSDDPGKFDTEDYMKYREAIGYRENAGKYGGSNQLGFLGKYQFGVAALEDLGYIKKGSAKKLGDNKNQDIIFKDPNNWTNGWSKEKFLSDSKAQDDAMERMTSHNLSWLRKSGYLKPDSTTQQISGLLAAMHLGGPGGVIDLIQKNKDNSDANATKVSDYVKYGEQIFAQNAQDNKGFQEAWKTAINKLTPSSTLSAASVEGPDQKMANELADMTKTVLEYMKAATGQVLYNNVDQSSKTNIIQEGSSGGTPVTDINPANIKDAVQSAVGK